MKFSTALPWAGLAGAPANVRTSATSPGSRRRGAVPDDYLAALRVLFGVMGCHGSFGQLRP